MSYTCYECNTVFKHRSSRSRHASRCKGKGACPGEIGVDNSVFEQAEDPPTSPADIGPNKKGFTEWAFQRISQGMSEVEGRILSVPVAKQIEFFYQNDTIRDLDDKWGSADRFMDTVDLWVFNQTSKMQQSTIAIRLGYLWWLAQWHLDKGGLLAQGILDYLEETRAELQRAGSMSRTNHSILAMADPYALCNVANTIVSRLQLQQRETLDPFMRRHLFQKQDQITVQELVSFGLDLRCWIDLAMRFVNVPTRIQCTTHLELPESTGEDYVAKLVCHGGFYVRVLNKDKVSASYEATQIPLCKTISAYLFYYIRYCRPKSSLPYVFLSKMGARWSGASADIKDYVERRLGVDPARVEPSGRFVHGSRHIGLACYAVATGFNPEKLRCFAVLMRHSLTMAEQIYCPWVRIFQARKAIEEFGRFRGMEDELGVLPSMSEEDQRQRQTFTFLKLRRIPDAIFAVIQDRLAHHFQEQWAVPSYDQVSVGTQTVASELIAAEGVAQQAAEQAANGDQCSTCNELVVYEGPYPVKREHRKYGRFSFRCSCKDGRSTYLELGVVPAQVAGMKRPRNIAEIREFVQEQTGKRFAF